MGSMAHSWIARDYGGLDVFDFVETEVPPPGTGEVTIEVRAAGMNPADYKHVAGGGDPADLPVRVGYEVAGVLSAVGPGTEIASGGGAVGDEVLAFRIRGGYSSSVTVPAADVFAKPRGLGFPEAANLLLAGTTAAEMLDVTGVRAGDTVLVHGASGAVGVSVLQQARLIGARVIGTAGERSGDAVRRFGGEPVAYGPGLERRVRDLAGDASVVAALDCVGTDQAIDVSLALVPDRGRIVSIANFARAEQDGYRVIMGRFPASAVFRDRVRSRLIELVVPVSRTFRLDEAGEAMAFLAEQHPGGKLALLP